MPSQEPLEAAEKADVSARICAWAARLAELDRTDDARQVFLDGLGGPGDPVPIMVALAELEADAGETDQERGGVFRRLLALLEPGVRDNPRPELLDPPGRVGSQRQRFSQLHARTSSLLMFDRRLRESCDRPWLLLDDGSPDSS